MGPRQCIVTTSYSKPGTGSRIVAALLDRRLAACIQVLPIRSFYRWRGRLTRDRENLMFNKARSRDYQRIERVILENHDYEVPEIISVAIDRGSAGYLEWMAQATK